MKKNMIQLREALRMLREEAQERVEAHLINKAMLAELESLRSERAAEAAELAEILSEIGPIVRAAAGDEAASAEDTKEATDA
jgi:Tfp pilus assembly protein PilV